MFEFNPEKQQVWEQRRLFLNLLSENKFTQISGPEGLKLRIVLDSCAIISDLARMAKKPEHELLIPKLQRLGYIDVHVAKATVIEMGCRTIPKFSKKRRVAAKPLHEAAEEYFELFTIHPNHDGLRDGLLPRTDIGDEDDWVVADLADDIKSDLLITNDTDFANYSRPWVRHPDFLPKMIEIANRSVHLASIKSIGSSTPYIASISAAGGYEAFKYASENFSPRVKQAALAMTVAGLSVALTIPTSRQWIFRNAKNRSVQFWDFLLEEFSNYEADKIELENLTKFDDR